MLVELANEFIALVVGDGENNHHSICPANAPIQLFIAAQAVLMDLKERGDGKVNCECRKEPWLGCTENSKEPLTVMPGRRP